MLSYAAKTSLPLSADAALSGSVSGLQGPAGPDAALPHCADRRGDVLLRDAPLSPRQAGHQGRERLGRDASGTLRLAPSRWRCFSCSLGGAAGDSLSLTESVASFPVYLKELEAAESRLTESGPHLLMFVCRPHSFVCRSVFQSRLNSSMSRVHTFHPGHLSPVIPPYPASVTVATTHGSRYHTHQRLSCVLRATRGHPSCSICLRFLCFHSLGPLSQTFPILLVV